MSVYIFFYVAGVWSFIPPDLSVHPTIGPMPWDNHSEKKNQPLLKDCCRGCRDYSIVRANWPGHPTLPKKRKTHRFTLDIRKYGQVKNTVQWLPFHTLTFQATKVKSFKNSANDLSITHELFECKTMPHISIYQFTKKTNQTEIQMHECIQIYNKSFHFFGHFNSSERPTYRELFQMKPQICTKCQK